MSPDELQAYVTQERELFYERLEREPAFRKAVRLYAEQTRIYDQPGLVRRLQEAETLAQTTENLWVKHVAEVEAEELRKHTDLRGGNEDLAHV